MTLVEIVAWNTMLREEWIPDVPYFLVLQLWVPHAKPPLQRRAKGESCVEGACIVEARHRDVLHFYTDRHAKQRNAAGMHCEAAAIITGGLGTWHTDLDKNRLCCARGDARNTTT